MSASMDSDEETFVTLGTPLEVFEDDEPIKKPVSIYDLQAKDSKGRSRFHGAFTGGFSAGFFNTVGSKEGFTPSTFVSSRKAKAESLSQNVEDFMDEEDMGEHGIAPKQFTTSSEYTSEERNRKRKVLATSLASSSTIPGEPALVDLVIPEKLSVGVRLLRKMGWKEGQGIGPRHKKKRKKKKKSDKSVRVIGCTLPPSESDEEESEEDFLQDVTFAPKDTNPVSFETKDNLHGLGYRGLDPKAALCSGHINLFEAPPVTSGGRKVRGQKGIRGQAFGVGALEEDDDDIYATDHLSNYDMTMDIDEKDSNFGWTAPRKHKPAETPVGYVGKLLEGFTLSSKTLSQKKVFKPPPIPRHYKPVHHFKKIQPQPLIQLDLNQSEDLTQQQTRKKDLNAVDRGLILGETPIFTSVFDLISKDDRKKMEEAKQTVHTHEKADNSDKISSQLSRTHNKTDNSDESNETSEETQTTENSKSIQSAPLFQGNLSFKPFPRDPDKQRRYDIYLNHVRQGHKDPYSGVAEKHMTEWERDREKEEFTKAGKLYKPLAGLMANRFTSAKYLDETDKADIPAENVEKTDEAKAAEMKMFGRLTRHECEWIPDKLLCRRFNVPHPYPGSTTVGIPKPRKQTFSVFTFLSFHDNTQTSSESRETSQTPLAIQDGKTDQDVKTDKATNLSIKVKPRSLGKPASIFSVLDSDNSKMTTATTTTTTTTDTTTEMTSKEQTKDNDERPSTDLFKAIFKNSDSESSSESEDDADDGKNKDAVVVGVRDKQGETVVADSEDKHSDAVKTDTKNEQDKGETSSPLADPVEERLSAVDEDNEKTTPYGPALPPSNPVSESVDEIADTSELVGMSADTHRKEKHRHRSKHKRDHKPKHKKEKKTKHKKSKHKKEKKEKKLRKKKLSVDNGYESSSESEGDTTPSDSDLLDRYKSEKINSK